MYLRSEWNNKQSAGDNPHLFVFQATDVKGLSKSRGVDFFLVHDNFAGAE